MFRILFFLFLSISWAQQPEVDCIKMEAHIKLEPQNKKVKGDVAYEYVIHKKPDTIRIDAVNMAFEEVTVNGKKAGYSVTPKSILIYKGFKKGKNTIAFKYSAQPRQALYFTGVGDDLQIWTQGQGKYTSHWLPSFDDVNEKVIFNLSVTHPSEYTVLANGTLNSRSERKGETTWVYQMNKPMSSYLVMLAIGKFARFDDQTTSGTSLEFYLDHRDVNKKEPTYRHTREVFDFFEKEIGMSYPWEVYRQVPIRDFLYAGMENTTSTIFSQDFVVDSTGFNDKTYVNVNAHELAHQWFGNLITAKSGTHHWLQEGFATYYALLAERELFGEDHFNWELYEMAERLQQVAKTDTIPLLNPNASTLTFYQKGAWALHYLRESVGETVFRESVEAYLKKFAYQTVETEDFLGEIEKRSSFNVRKFRTEWLEKPGLPIGQVLSLLNRSTFIRLYFELIALQEIPFEEKKERLQEILESTVFFPIKEEVLFQLADVPFEEKEPFLRWVIQSGDLKTRQTLARILTEVPESFRESFETLLEDPSYITQEITLSVLWRQFSEHRERYLNTMKDAVGFNDKNIRMLWLTLALLTPEYQQEYKVNFYDELLAYASPQYESSMRQNALNYLLYLNPNDQNILKHLVQATTHHRWQFVLFARNKLRELIKSEPHRKFLETMIPDLNQSEQTQLKRLLKEE